MSFQHVLNKLGSPAIVFLGGAYSTVVLAPEVTKRQKVTEQIASLALQECKKNSESPLLLKQAEKKLANCTFHDGASIPKKPLSLHKHVDAALSQQKSS